MPKVCILIVCNVCLFCRYDVDNTDLLQLRLLAQQKQLSDYKAAKDAKLVTVFKVQNQSSYSVHRNS